MKLFRRREPKSSHPHAEALEHISNAHRSLMRGDAEEGRRHLGRAFAAVHHTLPKASKPDADTSMADDALPDAAPGAAPSASPSPAVARLRGLNQRGALPS